MEYIKQQPLGHEQRALFLRRWLAAETGEAPSAVQGACFVDLKRKNLELRPHLRRVYFTVQNLEPYAGVIQMLGFRVLPDRKAQPNMTGYSTAMLDFGPSSVDGSGTRSPSWLRN